jgi:hypothetical protein
VTSVEYNIILKFRGAESRSELSDKNMNLSPAFLGFGVIIIEQLLSPENLDEDEIIWLGEKVSREEMQKYFTGLINKSNIL